MLVLFDQYIYTKVEIFDGSYQMIFQARCSTID